MCVCMYNLIVQLFMYCKKTHEVFVFIKSDPPCRDPEREGREGKREKDREKKEERRMRKMTEECV